MASPTTGSGTIADPIVEPTTPRSVSELPEKPVAIIEARQGWNAQDYHQLWAYRELLYFLTWRDLKVRYKQTVLGVAWVVMQPLAMTVIFTIFLSKLARVPSDGAPYPLFVFAGMLPWLFVSSSIVSSVTSLVGNTNLITKVYFPRMLVPAAIVCGRLFDFFVSSVVFAAVMFLYRAPLTKQMLMLPLLIALMILLALSISLWAAAVNVKYRDIAAALPVLVQLWMFTSPVVYPSSIVLSHNISAGLRWLYSINPMVGIIDNFRAAILGSPFNWPALLSATVITIGLFIYAGYEFRRLETTFADMV